MATNKNDRQNIDPRIAVRQMMNSDNIHNNEDWRFIMLTEQGKNGKLQYKLAEDGKPEVLLIGRRLLQVSNEKLTQILNSDENKAVGLRLANTNEVVDAHRPFDNTKTVYGNFPFPWGRQVDFSDAQEVFTYQGLSRSGIFMGPSLFNSPSEDGKIGGNWVVTGDGNRLGAPWNIHGDKSLEQVIDEKFVGNAAERGILEGSRGEIKEGERAGVRGNLESKRASLSGERGEIKKGERGSLETRRAALEPAERSGIRGEISEGGERGKLEGERAGVRSALEGERGIVEDERADTQKMQGFIRPAGVAAAKELEGNEAYILAKTPNAQEREFFLKAVEAIGPRLSADQGIAVLTPPDFENKKAFFIPSGGCNECANFNFVTLGVVNNEVKGATDIKIELPEEMKRAAIIMEERIKRGELTSKMRAGIGAIANFYEITAQTNPEQAFEIAAKMVGATKNSLTQVEQTIFLGHLGKNFGDLGKKLVQEVYKPNLEDIKAAEQVQPEQKRKIG